VPPSTLLFLHLGNRKAYTNEAFEKIIPHGEPRQLSTQHLSWTRTILTFSRDKFRSNWNTLSEIVYWTMIFEIRTKVNLKSLESNVSNDQLIIIHSLLGVHLQPYINLRLLKRSLIFDMAQIRQSMQT
jgi:hypothetical protein